MEFTSTMSALGGNAKVNVSVTVDPDSALESAVTEQLEKTLDEINGEVI